MITPDYLRASDGTGDASLMRITSNRSIGSTVINVDTIVGVPEKFIAMSGTLLPTGFVDPLTVTNFSGHIDGTSLEIDEFAPGNTDNGNTENQVVVIKPNTDWANIVAENIEKNQFLTEGKIPLNGAFSYSSDDSPTFVMTGATDDIARISVGMVVSLVQSATQKFFFVTAKTTTTLTLYGGTDYVLANSAITSVTYSPLGIKPFGFPMDPEKWSITVFASSQQDQISPVQNTWYNKSALNISVPIGIWNLGFQMTLLPQTAQTTTNMQVALSTTNNGSTDPYLS